MIPAAFESVGLTFGMIALLVFLGLAALVVAVSWTLAAGHYALASRRERKRRLKMEERRKRAEREIGDRYAFANYRLDSLHTYDREHPTEWFWPAGVATIITVILAGLIGSMGAAPFRSQYWSQYRVEGTIVEASNTLTEASGELTQTPVVRLDTVPDPLYADQARLTTMKGDEVSLLCVAVWHFRAAPTYQCRLESVIS